MTDELNKEEAQPEYLGMSDADLMAAPMPDFDKTEPEAVTVVVPVEPDVDIPAEVSEDADEDTGTVSEEAVENTESEEVSEVAQPENKAEATKEVEEVKEEIPAIDYEAEYQRILAPFKANGKDITVTSVDDAIALMQMGANYNKKMAGLKPNLKLMKLLENNGLLSESKISFLIELEKKNPDAINKLVKDSGINPMDFDAEKAGEYEPKIHTIDDKEMELDAVLDDIQGTPTYNRTLEIVSKSWDGASKQAIAGSPQLLKVINDHVQNGIYDLISKEVESERVFGRLNGMSDIEAYRKVGDAIQAKGGFNHLGSSQAKTPTAPVVVTPKPKKVNDAVLNEKRRAASSTKPVVSSPLAKDFNPLALSDEEFSKLSDSRFR